MTLMQLWICRRIRNGKIGYGREVKEYEVNDLPNVEIREFCLVHSRLSDTTVFESCLKTQY